jgi:hypothetical protein
VPKRYGLCAPNLRRSRRAREGGLPGVLDNDLMDEAGSRVSRWEVLLLSTGAPETRWLRDGVADRLGTAGFEVSTWDRPGYPAVAGVDPFEACVRAAAAAAIVIAFLDWGEGSILPWEMLKPSTRAWLQSKAILIPAPAVGRTVTQVEVLTALAFSLPVVVLVPDGILHEAKDVLRGVADQARTLQATIAGAAPARSLIEQKDWLGLLGQYDVPSLPGKPVRQAAFLDQLSDKTYIHSYRPGYLESATAYVMERLPELAVPTTEGLISRVEELLGRKRNPFDPRSVLDLSNEGLIVAPPYTPLSGGQLLGGRPLLRTAQETGVLAALLLDGKNVLVLGDPGIGKTTSGMLAAHAALTSALTPDPAVLFLTLRGAAPAQDDQNGRNVADRMLRAELGSARHQPPWPGPLPTRLHLVLDGLDEAALTTTEAVALVETLAGVGPLLITCRTADYRSGLHACSGQFDAIIEFKPWGEVERDAVCRALRTDGRDQAAAYVERHGRREPDLLSLPLWIACAVFACEAGRLADGGAVSDYALLMHCADALAAEEWRRAGLDGNDSTPLSGWWSRCAWEDNRSRRAGQLIRLDEMLELAGVPEDQRARSAAMSQLEVQDGTVRGFHHDVFRDFWLARGVVDALRAEAAQPTGIGTLLASQRSPLANKLIRATLMMGSGPGQAPTRLRRAFAETTDPRARNQILYLLGRINASPETKAFLAEQWARPGQDLFVKYSAGWAAALTGDIGTESAFFAELSQGGPLDELNRAYHRLYYEDSSLAQVEVPSVDDGGSADNAVSQLLTRISGNEPQYIALRRIELLTLVRFAETRGRFNDELMSRLSEVVALMPQATEPQRADVAALTQRLRDFGGRQGTT